MRGASVGYSSALLVTRAVLLLALAVCTLRTALGFEQAGHYYTISLVSSLIQPPLMASQVRVTAFCAQLPDHSSDLTATRVYGRIRKEWTSPGALVGWVRRDEVSSIWIQRMVTVQQLLHGLTGGSASAVQSVAANSVRQLRQQALAAGEAAGLAPWCALGFALHLYGDAFAHRMMGDPGDDPDTVYETGVGHGGHFHYPDWPLCGKLKPKSIFAPLRQCEGGAGRFKEWGMYWKQALELLAPAHKSDPKALEKILEGVSALAKDSKDTNSWGEAEIAEVLGKAGADRKAGEFLANQKSDKPCEDVLHAAVDSGPLAGFPPFKCNEAWSLFYKAVEPEFAANSKARKPLGTDFAKAYIPNPLLK